jgi:biopolymer transport protein ExbD
MQFSSRRAHRRQPAEINITSLVDIIFNLLLFFMLTTSFSQSEGITVELPSASAAETQSSHRDLVVTITRSGQAMVEGKVISLEALSVLLVSTRQETPDLVLMIRADEAVAHARVVDIIDLAKKSGLQSVAIATRSE